MTPGNTEYKLATTADYVKCHTLMRDLGEIDAPIRWPTLVAKRGKKVVGFLGTIPSKEAVIAGPLAVDLEEIENPAFVALRLFDLYDQILYTAGIEVYLFTVEVGNKKQISLIERSFGLEPYTEQDGMAWFRRTPCRSVDKNQSK